MFMSKYADAVVEWDISLIKTDEFSIQNLSIEDCGNEEKIRKIDAGDYVIIPHSDITICFDYPLVHPIYKKFHHAGGFSRKTILKCVYQVYCELYKAPANKSLIFGHTMEELIIIGIEYDPVLKLVKLQIES